MDKLSTLLQSGRYSDLKIRCGSKEWLVHRAIICPQSEYFTAICDSNFKEGISSEIDLSTNNIDHVEQMLKFLYTGSYDDISAKDSRATASGIATPTAAASQVHQNLNLNNSTEDDTNIPDSSEDGEDGGEANSDVGIPPLPFAIVNQLHQVAMYVLGDRYLIPDLRLQAAQRFFNGLPDRWDPALWPVVRKIDENTSPGEEILRGFIIELWLKNSVDLLSDDHFRHKITQFPDFELPLLRKHAVQANIRINSLKDLPVTVSKLTAQVTHLRLDTERLTSRLTGVKDAVRDKILPLTTEWSQCRNCSADFGCRLEEYDIFESHAMGLFTRCRRCQAKHHHGGKADRVEW
ncbi:hypothetical protein TWF696_007397 [Orbilia brochopaga]|uniref:BTB domain-containing protein n=1 Tax=Orbilia brochopaga TaxID=3140254 RepID=A0AAV9UVE1_9PEZI